MLDRRQTVRRRTMLEGTLRIEKLPLWAVTCTVRNVSEGGMCIVLPARKLIPERFDLGVGGEAARRARLVWATEGRAGLSLIETRGAAPSTWQGRCRRSDANVSNAERLSARIDAIRTKAAARG